MRISLQAFDRGLCKACLESAVAKRAPASAAGALPDDPTQAWQVMRVKQRFEVLDTAKFVQAGKKTDGHVRFVVISDTHDHHFCEQQGHRHPAPIIPEGDVLIHAGDYTSTGTEHQVAQFNAWLGSLPHKHKIVIAGNHELTFDLDSYPQLWQRFCHPRMLDAPRIKGIPLSTRNVSLWDPRAPNPRHLIFTAHIHYTYTCIHIHIAHAHYTYTLHIHMHTHAYTCIHMHTHTYTCIHIHTHTHCTYTLHIHIHTHAYTYIHMQPPSRIVSTLKMRRMR
jgi:hypothetical protein